MINPSRRTALGSLASAFALPACTFGSGRRPSRATADVALRTLIGEDETRQLPAAGFVVMKDGRVIASAAEGDASGLDPAENVTRRPFTIDTPFRAASISKMVVALTALRLAERGGRDLDAPLPAELDALLRHPAFPETPLTLRQLLAHTTTIQDPAEYWVAAPGDIRSLLTPDLFRMSAPDGSALVHGPGDWFEYANLNYGIAATVMETDTGERFDRLALSQVLQPLGIRAGFNWSGVASDRRRAGATLYRKRSDGWTAQVDDPETLNGTRPSVLSDPSYDLRTYPPGTNGTLFSPQGGLRASLTDLARLAALVGRTPALTGEVWRLNAQAANGHHEDYVFQSFGTGVFRHEAGVSPWRGQAMIGHHGEAYGLYAGAWHLPGLGIELAYAVTGTPDGAQPSGGRHTAFNVWEQSLVNIARATVG